MPLEDDASGNYSLFIRQCTLSPIDLTTLNYALDDIFGNPS